MTNQEIFDKVLNHLRQQGHAATVFINGETSCRYRAGDGGMCAVGCLIPDELYTPEIEDNGVFLVERLLRGEICAEKEPDVEMLWSTLQQVGIAADQLPLLRKLQSAHDGNLNNYGIGAWELEMANIADDFDLHYTPATGE